MSIEINFAIFHGLKLPEHEDICENLAKFMKLHPELFTDYHSYYNENEPANEEDVRDEWHDRGYIIEGEGLGAFFLGETLYHTGSYSDDEITEFPKMPVFSDLPLEVAGFIIMYYPLTEVKVYSITYYT